MLSNNRCVACGSDLDINKKFNLGQIPFFYGIKDLVIEKALKKAPLDADIVTCSNCGLTQQLFQDNVLKILDRVYKSQGAAASTPPSDSGWGLARAKMFFDNVNILFKPNSVLEVGCQDGYMLYEFYKRGVQELIGVEPSPLKPFFKDGFQPVVYHEFFDRKRFDGKKFDIVLSLFVLEHVQYPAAFLKELASVLSDDGQLIIAAPNAEMQLRSGDPGLFMHEHLSYFTEMSLKNVFFHAGLEIIRINKTRSDYYITARKKSADCEKTIQWGESSIDNLVGYKNRLYQILERFKTESAKFKRLGLWGACAATSNLIYLTSLRNYTVFDGDKNKEGKQISGIQGIIFAPTKEALENKVDAVCVIPMGFQKEIGRI